MLIEFYIWSNFVCIMDARFMKNDNLFIALNAVIWTEYSMH